MSGVVILSTKEFGQFVMALKTYYPKENLLPNNQAVELWYQQLGDIPYKLAEMALNKWVATNKWSPSISEIRGMVAAIHTGDIKDWGAAWEDVRMAVRLYGSYQPAEALESLDELTRDCVRRIGYNNICFSENLANERANFRMIYEQLAERKKTDRQIPAKLAQAISQMKIIKQDDQSDYDKFKNALEELGKEIKDEEN